MNFKTTLYLTLGLLSCLLLFACNKDYDEIVPSLEGVPAAGMQKLTVLNVEEEIAEFEITLFAVDHFGNFIQNLKTGNFSVTSAASDVTYSLTGIEEIQDEFVGPYSAGLLFDQSGSINDTDPDNDRIAAGVAFVDLLQNGDEGAVGAFTTGSQYQNPYELLEPFSADQVFLTASIEGLAGNASGGTPLYRAVYDLISYVSEEGNNENKAIIAFTDGGDTEGGVSIDQLVARACEENVSIYTVGLGQGIDVPVLSEIAFRTGGSVMLAEDAVQLISLYSSLGQLLQGEARLYNLRLRAERNTGNWTAGSFVGGTLNLNLSEEYPVRLPFQVFLNNSNAGSLDTRTPTCNCDGLGAQDLIDNYKAEALSYREAFTGNANFNTEPNNKITCAYASIYKTNPEKFKWAGLAAIVSGIIGEELANQSYWEELLGSTFFAGIKESTIEGNAAVFDDLFWQHLAFQNGGISEIGKIYCAGGISIEVYRAWLKIAQDDPINVYEGNKDLLYHEQKNILQQILYTPHPTAWSNIQYPPLGLAETRVVSPVPGKDDKMPEGTKIDVFNDRWAWLENTILPDWRIYERNSDNVDELKSIHEGYCPDCCN